MSKLSYESKIELEERLSRRNAISAQQGMRELDGRISEIYNRFIEMNQAINAITVRLNEVERLCLTHKAASFGTGATDGDNGGLG